MPLIRSVHTQGKVRDWAALEPLIQALFAEYAENVSFIGRVGGDILHRSGEKLHSVALPSVMLAGLVARGVIRAQR
jgi:hypothetical protein